MTRGLLLAWLGAGVAAAAILAALFWPMNADVAPLPAATSTSVPAIPPPDAEPPVLPAPTMAAPVQEIATTDARGRVVRKPMTNPGADLRTAVPAPAAAAPPAARDPAPEAPRAVPAQPTTPTTTGGGGGDGGGDRGFDDFFPGG